jgi:hypothetical protein
MARANKDDKSDDADETADEQAKDTVVQVLDYYEENFTQVRVSCRRLGMLCSLTPVS